MNKCIPSNVSAHFEGHPGKPQLVRRLFEGVLVAFWVSQQFSCGMCPGALASLLSVPIVIMSVYY